MYLVEMKVGRFWWWIRTEKRQFANMGAAWAWANRKIDARKWWRYSIEGPDGMGCGGGNF